jgi:hypothetical protein
VVQDWVDYAFTSEFVGFHVGRTQYPLFAVSRLDGLLGEFALNHSYKFLSDALEPIPNTMPGPGGTSRDPLVVYYDAQVNDFVK